MTDKPNQSSARLTGLIRTINPRRISQALVALAMCVTVVGLLFYLAGSFHPKVPGQVAAADKPAMATETTVQVRSIRQPRFEMAVGTIRAVHEVTLSSKLLASVKEVRVKAGQKVVTGELLLLLDDAELKAKQSQAKALREAAQAALAQAGIDHARAKTLRGKNAVPQADLDQAATALRTATANVERAEQALKETDVLLGYAMVVSPFDGIVVEKVVEPGDTAVPGQRMLTLYDPSHMQMVATVRESLAQRLKVGDRVPARLESLGYECDATISEIVPESQTASRSFTVKVTGPCPPGVYAGMYGRLFIPLDQEDILVIPQGAVSQIGQLDLVHVVENGRMLRRQVQLGRTIGEDVEVLSGLDLGERLTVRAVKRGPTKS